MQEGSLPMEPKNAVENLWRIWVDTNRRIDVLHVFEVPLGLIWRPQQLCLRVFGGELELIEGRRLRAGNSGS